MWGGSLPGSASRLAVVMRVACGEVAGTTRLEWWVSLFRRRTFSTFHVYARRCVAVALRGWHAPMNFIP